MAKDTRPESKLKQLTSDVFKDIKGLVATRQSGSTQSPEDNSEYRIIFENINELIVLIDNDGTVHKVISTNPQDELLKDFDYDTAQSIYDYPFITDPANFKTALGKKDPEHSEVSFEFRTDIDGRFHLYSARLVPLSAEMGILYVNNLKKASQHKPEDSESNFYQTTVKKIYASATSYNNLDDLLTTIAGELNQSITNADTVAIRFDIDKTREILPNNFVKVIYSEDRFSKHSNVTALNTGPSRTTKSINGQSLETAPVDPEHAYADYLQAPIHFDGELIGKIEIMSDTEATFTEEDLNLIDLTAWIIQFSIDIINHDEIISRSTEKFRMLFEKSPVPVCTVDRDFDITNTNKRLSELLDIAPRQLKGMNLRYLNNGPLIDLVEQAIDGHTVADESYFEFTSLDDAPFLSVNVEPLYDFNSTVIGALIVFMDRTVGKKAEEKIVESEQIMRSVLDNIPDFIVEIRESGEILYANKHVKSFTGFEPDEFVSLNIYDIIDEKDKESFIEKLNTIDESNLKSTIKCNMLNKEQKNIKIIAEARSHVTPGGELRYVISIKDRSYTKMFDKQKELIKKYKDISKLVAGVTHDFGNYVTIIKANIDLAELEVKAKTKLGSVTNKLSTYLENAQRASDRAFELSRNLTSIVKNTKSMDKKPVYLPDILEEAAKISGADPMFNIESNINNDIHLVKGDEAQLTRVISNLLTNAQQSMPQGGTIQINAENRELEPENTHGLDPGTYVLLNVHDQGVGIPNENLEKIFDPYFTTKQRGTGLGLANCQNIIEQHQGHIWAESQVGEGTSFYIELPAIER